MTTGIHASAREAAKRRGARVGWSRMIDLHEDWAIVLLGVAAVIVTVGLGVAAFASAQGRDLRLADAAAVEGRLTVGGADDDLVFQLITLQLDEIGLFQAHVDSAGPRSTTAGDPRTDLRRIESDLAAVSRNSGDSARVLADVDVISRELPTYTDLEATAQADNQQGLPAGAAYLRDASGYLRTDILPRADDIRAADQARLAADDVAAASTPVVPAIAYGLGLAYLVAAQIVLARRSRRVLNPAVFTASILVAALAAWSITNTLLSRNLVDTRALPHANAATDLERVRGDALRAQLDDELSMADHGEDCSASTTSPAPHIYHYAVTCAFEQEVLAYLNTSTGLVPNDLARARHDTPDPATWRIIDDALSMRSDWYSEEYTLPTLQNLTTAADTAAARSKQAPRYSTDFDQNVLQNYAQADTSLTLIATFIASRTDVLEADVRDATRLEWNSYDGAVADAKGTLGGLATTGLLLGLLAGAAVAIGFGGRVAEYWSVGRSRTTERSGG